LVKTIVFLGFSNSGKTNAIVSLTRELVETGKKVGTLKHIHEAEFTIDTEGKDTWRHAAAGASVVVALAPRELTTIEKKDTNKITFGQLSRLFKRQGVDYLIVEGFYRRLPRKRGIVYILCSRSNKEAIDLLKMHPRPVCILSTRTRHEDSFQGIPLLCLPKDMKRLLRLMDKG
jgi:molybdopterin-guanine dinucleotide biosynthesis protein MobB